MNTLFLCLNLPICIGLIMANMGLQPSTQNINILNLLMFLNSGLLFPLFFLSNKIFQKEFRKIFQTMVAC